MKNSYIFNKIFIQNFDCLKKYEKGLPADSVSIGRANEERATILQDSKIAYRREAIPEGQGAGRAAGQLDFAANSECSGSKLKCYKIDWGGVFYDHAF